MADAKKNKPVKATSPRGVAGFPYLNIPDTKFDKDGVYKVTLTVDAALAAPLIAKIDAVIEQEFQDAKAALIAKGDGGKAKKLTRHEPYSEVCDDEGEPTGKVKISFKSKASYTNKKGETVDNKPALFDAALKPFSKPVYSGSEIKVSTQIAGYFNAADLKVGASLRIEGVQVLKLVSGGGDKASAFEAEDGYEDDGEDRSAAFSKEPEEDLEADTGTPTEGPVDF